MSDVITAPWTDEQVEALNAFQTSNFFHPFTCPRRGSQELPHFEYGGYQGELIATADGWTCRDCDYTQQWAHRMMADKGMLERVRQSVRDEARGEEIGG